MNDYQQMNEVLSQKRISLFRDAGRILILNLGDLINLSFIITREIKVSLFIQIISQCIFSHICSISVTSVINRIRSDKYNMSYQGRVVPAIRLHEHLVQAAMMHTPHIFGMPNHSHSHGFSYYTPMKYFNIKYEMNKQILQLVALSSSSSSAFIRPMYVHRNTYIAVYTAPLRGPFGPLYHAGQSVIGFFQYFSSCSTALNSLVTILILKSL